MSNMSIAPEDAVTLQMIAMRDATKAEADRLAAEVAADFRALCEKAVHAALAGEMVKYDTIVMSAGIDHDSTLSSMQSCRTNMQPMVEEQIAKLRESLAGLSPEQILSGLMTGGLTPPPAQAG